MFPDLQTTIAGLALPDTISADRLAALDSLAARIRASHDAGDTARLTFICTHNSRRSHIAQIWAQTLAHHHGVGPIETYSGGTEATAFNPRAVASMRRMGFDVLDPGGDNPRYEVRWAAAADPMICFSKTYDDAWNPARDFTAVMVCSDADERCPVVAGATHRVAIPYEDPKAADDTDQEAARYDERSRQIAAEIDHVMRQMAGS